VQSDYRANFLRNITSKVAKTPSTPKLSRDARDREKAKDRRERELEREDKEVCVSVYLYMYASKFACVYVFYVLD